MARNPIPSRHLDLGALPLSLHRATAHESVRNALRNAILRGDLPAGSRLIQGDIAKRLGVSTTPVREALRDLATDGLVQFDPFRGAVVQEPTLEDAQDVYELRCAGEPIAIRRAEPLSEANLERAEQLVAAMDQETDVAEWVGLNRLFHATLLELGRTTRLERILKGLRDAAVVYVAFSMKTEPERMRSTNHDHKDLLAACREGDTERTVEVTIHHLRRTLRTLEELLAPAQRTVGAGRSAQ